MNTQQKNRQYCDGICQANLCRCVPLSKRELELHGTGYRVISAPYFWGRNRVFLSIRNATPYAHQITAAHRRNGKVCTSLQTPASRPLTGKSKYTRHAKPADARKVEALGRVNGCGYARPACIWLALDVYSHARGKRACGKLVRVYVWRARFEQSCTQVCSDFARLRRTLVFITKWRHLCTVIIGLSLFCVRW